MKAIGGYFELERVGGEEYYPDLLKLNTGRNCLEYLLKAGKFRKIYLPKFSCKVLLEPIQKLNLELEYYSVDHNLDPVLTKIPGADEVLLYINYFGIKDARVEQLNLKIENLIVDNSQAFYSFKTSALGTFYSARKFFGVSDGAYLSTNLILNEELKMDFSCNRFGHLLKRFELGAESGYQDFQENSLKLSNQPILQMSELTKSLLSQINYPEAKRIREENFEYLHHQLSQENQLNILNVNGPMVYPFYAEDEVLRKELIKNKIFVATYWPNVLQDCPADSLEYNLAKYILPIPIDQRYNQKDMERICNVLT